MRSKIRSITMTTIVIAALMSSIPLNATVQVRGGVYGLYLEPQGDDAEKYGRGNWGGGLYLLVVPPNTNNLFAGVLGFDVTHFLSQTIVFRDQITLLEIEQQTKQYLYRVYLGGRLGHQGHGFIRPYAAAHLALNIYSISLDVVIPNDVPGEPDLRQHVDQDHEFVFGFDITAGVELNFGDRFYADGGAKFIKSFSVPQQLGLEDAETIHPNYIQIFVGFNIRFQ